MIVDFGYWVWSMGYQCCDHKDLYGTVRDNYKTLGQSHTKTKLAYVDAVAKPLRGVKKVQELFRIFDYVGMPHKNGLQQPKPVSVREPASSSKICALQ